jgi:TolB protein
MPILCRGRGLREAAAKIGSTSFDDGSPEWSPGGGRTAFVSSRDYPQEEGVSTQSNDVYVMNDSGGNVRRLTSSKALKGAIDWAPDGDVLVYQTQCLSHVCSNRGDVRVVQVDSGDSYGLTSGDRPDRSPSWSPDGSWVTYVRSRSGDADLMLVSRDGERRRVLLRSPGDSEDPDWRW